LEELMKQNRWVVIGVLAFFGIALTSQPVFAADESDDSEVVEDLDYRARSARKLGRGLSNTALGWIELPTGIHDMGKKHGAGAAATWGLLYGAGRAIQRTALGVYEVFTFPFGIPDDFEPLIEPEYMLQDTRD
jgi:putative exosortase-associated protein (TIGR04073 family)